MKQRQEDPEIRTSQDKRFAVRASLATKAKLGKVVKVLNTTYSEFIRACIAEADRQLKAK